MVAITRSLASAEAGWNGLRRRADHDRDLLLVLELDLARIAAVGSPADVDRDRGRGLAVAAYALAVELDVPLGEELAQRVELILLRLGVEHAVDEMRVERGNTRGRTGRVDPSVADRAVAGLETMDGRVVDLDPYACRDPDGRAVDEDVEVCVHMQEDELVCLGGQPRADRELHRVCGRGPRRRTLGRRGSGRGGGRRRSLGSAAATAAGGHEQGEKRDAAPHPRHPIHGTLDGSHEEE